MIDKAILHVFICLILRQEILGAMCEWESKILHYRDCQWVFLHYRFNDIDGAVCVMGAMERESKSCTTGSSCATGSMITRIANIPHITWSMAPRKFQLLRESMVFSQYSEHQMAPEIASFAGYALYFPSMTLVPVLFLTGTKQEILRRSFLFIIMQQTRTVNSVIIPGLSHVTVSVLAIK